MSCAVPNSLHWEDLRKRSKEHILMKPGVSLLPEGTGYQLRFLNQAYKVDASSEQISEVPPDSMRHLSEPFQILLIRYLISDYSGPLEGKDVSEKDFPGGVTFFQGPHALHVTPIATLYGHNPEAFEKRSLLLGAHAVPYGDRAMRFYPFPLVPITYILWKADEEFPASVTLLFDSSISRWFELDMIFTLVLVLTERIVESGELTTRHQ